MIPFFTRSPSILSAVPGRLFAIGDIHGCADELKILLNYLTENLEFSKEDTMVFLGDYIDRGPNSFSVIEQILDIQIKFPKIFCLSGNHEELLVNTILGQEKSIVEFLRQGGKDTLVSYGLKPKDVLEIEQKLPKAHLEFYLNLERYVISANHVFVHAGLNPENPLLLQANEDIRWIRLKFINSSHDFKKIIVFGHTPQDNVLMNLPYNIGIDTGCVFGGKLTAFEVNRGSIYQVARGGTEVDVIKLS